MISEREAICQCVNQPKLQIHNRHYYWLQRHKRLAAELDLLIVYLVR